MINTFNDPYTTQQDFDRQIRSIQRFSRQDATKIVENFDGEAVTNWEKKELQYKVNTANQTLKKQRKELEKSPELAKIGNLNFEELKDINPKEMEFTDWNKFSKMLENKIMSKSLEKRYDKYKESFLKKLDSMPGDTEAFYNFISRVPAKVLYDMRYQDDKSLRLDFFYDPTDDGQWLIDTASEKWHNALGLQEGETYEDKQASEFLANLEKLSKGS
jgi:hypothetical protein